MTDIQRMRCEITGGGVVGPSVTTFYWTAAATGMTAKVFTFFDSIKTRLPSIVSVTIPNTGDVLEAETGELQGTWTDGTATGVGGLGTAQCPQGVGCRVVWNTNTVAAGRRVRGSTFLVPLDASMYSTLGLLSASRSQIESAAAALVTAAAGDMIVWSRPKPPPGGIGPDTPGGTASITSSTVPNKITTLRTRRT